MCRNRDLLLHDLGCVVIEIYYYMITWMCGGRDLLLHDHLDVW